MDKKPHMDNQTIAERLKYHRKSKGYSQEELAHRTSITVRTIQRIEGGSVTPHLNTVKLLATALDVEVNELIPLENPNEESVQTKWLLLLHATPLLGVFLPLGNVLIPLFLWIHKREDNDIYNQHGIKVINFQITALLLVVLSFISLVTIEKWGFFLFIGTIPICIGIVIANIIYVVKKRKCYYPLAIPFLGWGKTQSLSATFVLILAFTFSQCTSPTTQQVERLDGSLINADGITAKIEKLAKVANVHGMAFAIFNNNEVVYQHISGYKNFPKSLPLSDSTNMYGASLSKAVFSVLVLKLVEEGVIDLDTPLESYLPKKIYEYEPLTRWHDDYSDLRNDSLYHTITARMCLAHTTGFPNWRFFEPDKKLRVLYTPGEKYGYSGEGFVYLQVVLEKLTGKGLEEMAQEFVFEPLGMTRSAYEWQGRFEKDFALGHMADGETYTKDKDNEPRGGSTLETSVKDYIRFLEAILTKEILTQESYNELFSPQVSISSLRHFGPDADKVTDQNEWINLSCALGWLYLESPYGFGVSKGGHGDGFQHYSILFPATGKGVLILTNSDNGEGIYKELLEYAFADVYTPAKWANYIPYNQR